MTVSDVLIVVAAACLVLVAAAVAWPGCGE